MNRFEIIFNSFLNFYSGNYAKIFRIAKVYFFKKKRMFFKQNKQFIIFVDELALLLEKIALPFFIIWMLAVIYQSLRKHFALITILHTIFANIIIFCIILSLIIRVSKLFKFFSSSTTQFLYPVIVSILLTLFFIPKAISETIEILRNIFPPSVQVKDLLIAQSFLEYRIIAAKWFFWGGMFFLSLGVIYGFLTLAKVHSIDKNEPKALRKIFAICLRGMGYIFAGSFIFVHASTQDKFYSTQSYTLNPDPLFAEKLVLMEYIPNAPLHLNMDGFWVADRIYCNKPVPVDSSIYPLNNGFYSVVTFNSNEMHFQEMPCPPFKNKDDLLKEQEAIFSVANSL